MSISIAQPNLLRRLYQRMMDSAKSPRATWTLALISFAESSVFPLPPDLMMIPMIIADKARAWRIAFICSVSSVGGALVGYSIGYYFFETVGRWVIDLYNLQAGFDWFQAEFQAKGFWIILAKGLTPIPFKLLTIASGAAKLSLSQFIIASVIARSFRFYVLASLLWLFGEKARVFIDRYLGLVFVGMLALVVAGILIVKMVIR